MPKQVAQPRCFLVLGTPRSGTSATAGVLSKLGVDFGPDWPPDEEWAPSGWFVDSEFNELASEAFEWDWPDWPYEPTKAFEETLPRIRELLNARCARNVDWGIKDSYLPWLLPVIVDVVTSNGHQPVLVTTTRPRESSLASFKARDGGEEKYAERVIDVCQMAVDESTRKTGLTAVTVDFDQLLDAPASKVAELASGAGKVVKQEAVDHIDARWRRF